METNARRWIEALRATMDRLTSLTSTLTPDQLNQPSYHSWTLAENLSHLGSQAEMFDGFFTAGLEGSDPPGRETMQPIWDAWNAKTAEQQARDSIAVNEALVERLESMSDQELDRVHLSAFGMELDAAAIVRMRLNELALHTWDVEVALNPRATVSPEAVNLLIDTVGQSIGRLCKPGGLAFRIYVHTTDPGRDFALSVGDNTELSSWSGNDADGRLDIPAEAFIRLTVGRLDSGHTPSSVRVTGSISLDELRTIFPGF